MVKYLLILLLVAATCHSASTPFKELRLATDADAGGHSITNLSPGATDDAAATVGQLFAAAGLLGPRVELLEVMTNLWNEAYSWGNHLNAGYVRKGFANEVTGDFRLTKGDDFWFSSLIFSMGEQHGYDYWKGVFTPDRLIFSRKRGNKIFQSAEYNYNQIITYTEVLGEQTAGGMYALPTGPDSQIATLLDIDTATTDLVQTYILSTNGWLTVSNNVLTITMLTNGVPTNVWSSAESAGAPSGIDPAATNALWVALNSGLKTKADKAWGKYLPDGSDNIDSDYMVMINKPVTVFGSGLKWATDGNYSVLATSGAVAFQSEEGGEVRWGTDLENNWFGIVQGGTYIIGANANSIKHNKIEQTTTITYPYAGGNFPTLFFSTDLRISFDSWDDISAGVAWVDNSDGTATVTAPATTAVGFYFATTSATFDAIFKSNVPARFDAGIFGSTNSLPVVPDSTIEITVGNKQYRLIAEEVK